MLSRVIAVYQDRGLSGLARSASVKLGIQRVGRSQPYQVKVRGALEQRFNMLRAAFPTSVISVLDIGCNLGDITARLAVDGYWTIGIDSSHGLIRQATKRHAEVEGCGFMVQHIGPDEIERLPTFDAILLLSVHHHWLKEFGPEISGEMLRNLTKKARHVVIFESASRRVRYGKYPPSFIDNDEASVTAYLESYLNQYVGAITSRIVPLGRMPCVGEREPYRWNFALYR